MFRQIRTIFTLSELQGVTGKLCFFLQLTAIMLAGDLSLKSLLLSGHFLYNQKQPIAGDGEVDTKTQFFLNTLENICTYSISTQYF